MLSKSGTTTAESGTIVWHSEGAAIDSDAVRQNISAMLTSVAQQPRVTNVDSPYTATGSTHINPTKNTAYPTITRTRDTDVTPVVSAAESAGTDELQVEL